LVFQNGVPVGNYLVVRVPSIYAPQMVYQLKQTPYAQHVYVTPQGYCNPVPVSQVPVLPQTYYIPNVPAAQQIQQQYQPHQQVIVDPQPQYYPGTPRPLPVMPPLTAVYYPPKVVVNPIQKAEPIPLKEVIQEEESGSEKSEKYNFLDDDSNEDTSDCFSDSDSESDSEIEIETSAFVPVRPFDSSTVPTESDDVAYAIQLDYIINEAENSFKQYSIPPPVPKPVPKIEDQELSMDEIIHLYKNGEPVEDYVHFYVGLHPEQADQVQHILDSEIASESILSNVQQWKKECDKEEKQRALIVSPEEFF